MAQGAFYLILANVILSMAGYLIHIGIARYLGPAEYGVFGVIISLMTWVMLFLISGLPRTASRYIARDQAKAGSIIRDLNIIQLVFCIVISGIYFGLAGEIASWFKDPSLVHYIRLSTLAIPVYAYCMLYIGYLNGFLKFGRQSLITIIFSLVKIGATFGLVVIGFGIYGAIMAYIISALVGLLLAWKFMGSVRISRIGFGWKELAVFSVPVVVYSVAINLLINMDLFFVKALMINGTDTGYYTAVSTISRLPYFVGTGLALYLLPSISNAMTSHNIELVRKYIRQSMRYMLMLLIPGIALITATSFSLLNLLYPGPYAIASGSLSVLIIGIGCVSIMLVLASIITGSGKPWAALIITLPLIGADFILCTFLIPGYGLVGAAWATTLTGISGMLAAAVYILWKFKTLISVISLGRIILASMVVYLIATSVPFQPLWLLPGYAGLLALYAVLLWLLGEFNGDDLRMVQRVITFTRISRHSERPV